MEKIGAGFFSEVFKVGFSSSFLFNLVYFSSLSFSIYIYIISKQIMFVLQFECDNLDIQRVFVIG